MISGVCETHPLCLWHCEYLGVRDVMANIIYSYHELAIQLKYVWHIEVRERVMGDLGEWQNFTLFQALFSGITDGFKNVLRAVPHPIYNNASLTRIHNTHYSFHFSHSRGGAVPISERNG